MRKYRFTVTLTLQGPVLSQAVETRRVGVDVVCLRDRRQRLALPGTLVRGVLRHAWETFQEHASSLVEAGIGDLTAWLGPSAEDGNKTDKSAGDYSRPRSRLRFDDYWISDSPVENAALRHRIEIDDETGAVEGGAYLTIESPIPSGQTVDFSGVIEVQADSLEEIRHLRRWLKKGFKFTPALGGLKGVGFGRLAGVKVSEPQEAPPERASAGLVSAMGAARDNVSLTLGLRIFSLGEFCFPRPGPKGNRFISEDFIPGAALKAVLAPRLRGKLDFDALRITHALPVLRNRTERPLAVPFSLVFGEPEGSGKPSVYELRDVALQASPGLIGSSKDASAPRFQPDWKDAHWQVACKFCGWDDLPQRRVRIRNRIDRETGTVRYDPQAQGGMLFSLETIAPERHGWLANLYLPANSITDRQAVLADLDAAFAAPLEPLGKTKIAARIEVSPEPYPFSVLCGSLEGKENTVIIVLQSAALLLPWSFSCVPTNGGATLLDGYRDAWNALSEGSLRLERFFARQAFGGGRYWWNHFRKRKEPYRPVILTLPGSVFVLQIDTAARTQALEKLQAWRDGGLPPLHPDSADWSDWDKNPWLAQNGYGEIAVNPTLHWDLSPRQEEWHGL